MDPILHWVDIDFDLGLAKLQMIVGAIGIAYFSWAYCRMKRRKAARINHPPPPTDPPLSSN
jgi:hypothetical protein